MSNQDVPSKILPPNRFWATLAAVAAVLAIPSFLLTLPPVQKRLFNNDPHMEIAVDREQSIYDPSKLIEGLEVSYQSRDLAEPPQKIVLSTITFRNSGGQSVTPSLISKSDPIGVKIDRGDLLEVVLEAASSDHLTDNFSSIINEDNSFSINPDLIFDPGEEVTLEVTILTSQVDKIDYVPTGKIASQNKLALIKSWEMDKSPGFLSRSFSGDFGSQMIRLLFYFFVGFGFIYIIMIATEKYQLSGLRKTLSKHDNITRWIRSNGFDQGEVGQIALATYLYLGDEKFVDFQNRMSGLTVTQSTNQIPSSVETINGVVTADVDGFARFLTRYEPKKNPLEYLYGRFGVVNNGEIRGDFESILSSIANRITSSGGDGRKGFTETYIVTTSVDDIEFYKP